MVSSISTADKWFTPIFKGFKDVTRFCWDSDQNTIFSDTLKDLAKGKANSAGKRAGGDGFNNIGSNSKKAWEASKEAVKGKSFWAGIKDALSPKNIAEDFKAAAKGTSKSKAVWGVISKRMPLIGNLIYLASEVPNIYHSFTDPQGGFGAGMKEVGKFALRFGAFTIGCAVGSAFGGPIGGMVLGAGAEWLVKKLITGENFTDQQEEAQAATKTKTLEGQTNAAVAQTAKDPKTLTTDETAKNDATAYNNPAFTGAMNYGQMPDLSKITDLDSLMASGYMKNGYTGVNSNLTGNVPNFSGLTANSGFNMPNSTGFNTNVQIPNIFNNQVGLYGKNAFQY